ncbi:centromere protein T-like [Lampris incognitus]|uniref:centromere protein T-like n=1 Tax=Lampris incognitus TaxID=2546036 RepID=UPI0024B4B142|nr:centromere protein T-like [Lampris incognitus]
MDSSEDVSARILLKNVLDTEAPRTPVTRSASAAKGVAQVPTGGSRCSDRLRRDSLSLSKKITTHRLRQSIKTRLSRVSMLSSEKSRLSSVVLTNTPAPSKVSILRDDSITPRYLLRNILLAEPEVSLLAHEGTEKKKTQLPSDELTMVHQSSTELSELDLPEMTMMTRASTRKRLGRKRPRQSLNVTTFERNLGEYDDVEEKGEETGELSTLSLGSVKMPYAEIHTEKTGLRRRITDHCRISVEEFGAAVQTRKTAGHNSQEVTLSMNEMAHSKGFTLDFSNLSQPDFTTNITNQDISICAPLSSIPGSFITQGDARAPSPHRDTAEGEEGGEGQRPSEQPLNDQEEATSLIEEEEDLEVSEKKEETNALVDLQTEEVVAESQTEGKVVYSQTEEPEVKAELQIADSQPEEDMIVAVNQIKEEVAFETYSQTEEEDILCDNKAVEVETDNGKVETEFETCSQAEEDVAGDDQAVEEVKALNETKEEEFGADLQTEIMADSLPEEDEIVPVNQTKEEAEIETYSQTEEEDMVSDNEAVEVKTGNGTEETEFETHSQTEEDDMVVDDQAVEVEIDNGTEETELETRSQTEEDDMVVDDQTVEVEIDNGTEETELETHSQTKEDDMVVDDQAVEVKAVNETEEEELGADSQMEEAFKTHTNGGGDAELTLQLSDVKHIVRRARHSEAVPIRPVAVDDGRGYYSMGAVPRASEVGSAAEGHSGVAAAGTEHSHGHSDLLDEAPSLLGGHSREGSDGSEDEKDSHPPGRLDEDSERSAGQEEEGASDGSAAEGHSGVAAAGTEHSHGHSDFLDEAPSPLDEQSREGSDGEEEEGESDELPLKTPAFVRQRRLFPSISTASPAVLSSTSTHVAGESSAPAQPRKAQRKKKTLAKSKPSLPKSYLMGVFKHFAKTKVSADVYPALQKIMDRFFDRMAEDLETYCLHAKRKTIEVEDVVLLLKRQGHVNDQVPVEVLIEKYLPMEYRRLLIPVATSGNVVVPKLKR